MFSLLITFQDHKTNEKIEICRWCGEIASNSKELEDHYKTHKCAKCDVILSHASQLKQHYKLVHGIIKENYSKKSNNSKLKCKICKKSYASEGSLHNHMISNHSGNVYQCSLCGLEFKHNKNLNAHLSRHKEKTVHCSECKASFYLKAELNKHINQVHRKCRPYVCHICNRSFCQRSVLKHHQAVHSSHKLFNNSTNYDNAKDKTVLVQRQEKYENDQNELDDQSFKEIHVFESDLSTEAKPVYIQLLTESNNDSKNEPEVSISSEHIDFNSKYKNTYSPESLECSSTQQIDRIFSIDKDVSMSCDISLGSPIHVDSQMDTWMSDEVSIRAPSNKIPRLYLQEESSLSENQPINSNLDKLMSYVVCDENTEVSDSSSEEKVNLNNICQW